MQSAPKTCFAWLATNVLPIGGLVKPVTPKHNARKILRKRKKTPCENRATLLFGACTGRSPSVPMKAAVADSLPRGTTAAIATSHRGLAMEYDHNPNPGVDSVKLPVAPIQETSKWLAHTA